MHAHTWYPFLRVSASRARSSSPFCNASSARRYHSSCVVIVIGRACVADGQCKQTYMGCVWRGGVVLPNIHTSYIHNIYTTYTHHIYTTYTQHIHNIPAYRCGLCLFKFAFNLLLAGHHLCRCLTHLHQVILHVLYCLFQDFLRILCIADCVC